MARPLLIHSSPVRDSLTLRSVSIGTILVGMLIAWPAIFVLSMMTAVFAGLSLLIWAITALILTAIFGFLAFDLMRAKNRALQHRESSTWFGLLRVVAWDPNEGVLFLKDKQIAFVDSNPLDGGGVKLLIPWLGEELAFRAPLEVRTTKYEDRNVLTKEYVPLSIRGAIYWRLTNLANFYLSVSRGIHEVNDRGAHRVTHGYDPQDARGRHTMRAGTPEQLEAGEEWLRLIAEEKTRAEVLKVRTGLLMADKVVEGLPAEMQSLVTPSEYDKATEGLAEGIRQAIEAIGVDYGIHVERVSLQEVQLDGEILKRAIAACKSAYAPLIAQRAATAKKMDLEAEAYGSKKKLEGAAEIIGSEAVGKREVLGAVQPMAFGGRGIRTVIDDFFGGFVPNSTAGGPPVPAVIRKEADGEPASRD